ncbi:MAG: hypothetical protein R3C26_15035 [Calditrichia bacterium]
MGKTVDGFEIHISSDPKYAKVVRCGVGHICELCGFPAKPGVQSCWLGRSCHQYYPPRIFK